MSRTLHKPSTIITNLLLAVTFFVTAILGAQADIAKPQIKIQWQFQTGAAIWAASTTVKGKTYFGSTDGNLYALNTKSGKLLWKFKTEGPIYSQPSVYGHYIYISSDDGYVYKIHRNKGKQIWKANIHNHPVVERLPIEADCCTWDTRASTPIKKGQTVFVGSADQHFYALNAKNGEVRWSFETQAQVRSDPLVVGKTAVFSSFDGTVTAVNSKTGEQLWQFATGQPIPSSPVAAGNKIIIGSRDTNLYALSLEDGSVIWNKAYEGGSWVESSAVYSHGLIYIGSSDWRVSLALNPKDGSTIWATRSMDGGNLARPALSCSAVYQGIFGYDATFMPQGGIVKINRYNGEVLWQFAMEDTANQVGHGVVATPEIVHGQLLFGALNGSFYSLRP